MISYLNYSLAGYKIVIQRPFPFIFWKYYFFFFWQPVLLWKYIIILLTISSFSLKSFEILCLWCLNFSINCGLFLLISLCFLWILLVLFDNMMSLHLFLFQIFLLFICIFPYAYYFCYILIAIAIVLFFFLWVSPSPLPVDQFISQMYSFYNLLHLLIQQVNNSSTKTYASSTCKAGVLEQWSITCMWSSNILPSHRKHCLDLSFLY